MPKPLTVGEIMTREVVTVGPEYTLREAIEVLTGQRVSGAPVISAGQLVGIVSTTDILDFVVATPPVPSLQPQNTEWGELAMDEEAEEESDDDEAGPAFYRDLYSDAGADVLERFAEVGSPEWDLLAEYTVDAVMTRKPVILPSSASVVAAAQLLRDRGVHRVLVVDNDELVGIVTTTDLARLIARGAASYRLGRRKK